MATPLLVLRWPWVGLGLLSMAFLLTLAARWIGLGVWLILPLLFAPFEVNATLMLTRRALESQRGANSTGEDGEGNLDEHEDHRHDLRTGENKASLYDADRECLGGVFGPNEMIYPQAGWHEQPAA